MWWDWKKHLVIYSNKIFKITRSCKTYWYIYGWFSQWLLVWLFFSRHLVGLKMDKSQSKWIKHDFSRCWKVFNFIKSGTYKMNTLLDPLTLAGSQWCIKLYNRSWMVTWLSDMNLHPTWRRLWTNSLVQSLPNKTFIRNSSCFSL